jgi:hypothetical protein
MAPSLDNEIRDQLASYILDEISLEEFEDWFVSASWNVNLSKNQSAINLVYEIELWLSEYSDHFRNEVELKNLFRPLVINYKVSNEVIPLIESGSNSRVEMWSKFLPSFDILYA